MTNQNAATRGVSAASTHRIAVIRSLAMSASIIALATAMPALAEPTRHGHSAPLLAQADMERPQPFSIPAGDLQSALLAFSQQTDLQLLYPADLTQGHRTDGVQGSFTPRDALNRLMAGTGLIYEITGGETVKIAKPSDASGATMLDPITVEADRARTANGSALTEGSGSYTTAGPVTAGTGLGLSLRETPQSVSVITRQRMDDQGLDSFGEVLDQTPGISVWSGASGSIGATGGTYARGYEVSNYQIDGVTVPTTYWGGHSISNIASIDTVIYDSVTVVRGATGLMTGAGDPSASIHLTRKRPTDRFQASLAQSAGSWNQYRTVGDVGGPLNESGSVRGRLVAAYDEGESWIDRYEGAAKVGYGVLEADLTDRTLLSLAVEHSRESSNSAGIFGSFGLAYSDGSGITPYSRSSNATTDWSEHDNNRTIVSATLEHSFTADWHGRLSYSHSSTDTTRKFGFAGVGNIEPDGTNQVWHANQIYESRVDAIDAKVTGKYRLWDREHDLVMGVSAADADIDQPLFILVRNAGTVSVLDWDGSGSPEPDWSTYRDNPAKTEITQSGAYMATRLRATEDLSIIAGARVSNWETRAENVGTGTVTDAREESGVVTPYAGVVYDLTPNLSAYGSYTEIFNPQTSKDTSGGTLAPEEGTNMEVGLKGEWFAGRLNASVAVFQSGKDNVAIADGDNLTPDGTQAYIAADDTEGRGLEFLVSGEPLPGWQVQAGYTRTALKDSDGNRLTTNYQAEHQVKLFTSWTPAGFDNLTLGGGLRWQSEIYVENTSNAALQAINTQDSYTVVDLLARYRFTEQVSLAVNLNNVFDETYRVQADRHNYGAPRSLYTTLKYQF